MNTANEELVAETKDDFDHSRDLIDTEYEKR